MKPHVCNKHCTRLCCASEYGELFAYFQKQSHNPISRLYESKMFPITNSLTKPMNFSFKFQNNWNLIVENNVYQRNFLMKKVVPLLWFFFYIFFCFSLNIFLYNLSVNDTLPDEMKFTRRSLVTVILYCIGFVIAAVGNLTVFVTLASGRYRKSRISLMICHLSAADLFVVFFMIPIEVI